MCIYNVRSHIQSRCVDQWRVPLASVSRQILQMYKRRNLRLWGWNDVRFPLPASVCEILTCFSINEFSCGMNGLI